METGDIEESPCRTLSMIRDPVQKGMKRGYEATSATTLYSC